MRWIRFLTLAVMAVAAVACQNGSGDVPQPVSEKDLSTALARARETGRNVLVVYGRETCPWSRRLREQVLGDAGVQSALQDLVYLRIEQGVNSAEFEKTWGKPATPTVVTLTAEGEPRGTMVSGVVNKADFLRYVAWAKTGEGPQPAITSGSA